MKSIDANSAGHGAAVRPGAWLLAAGTALTLQPTRAGVLQVWDGGLWATSDGPHAGPHNDRGDRLLGPGDSLRLQAGERLVVERLQASVPARFTWDPLPPDPAAEQPAAVTTVADQETAVKRFRHSPAFSFLGWTAPAPLARLLLALLSCGLTASLWLGAAAASGEHRLDAGVSAPQPLDVRTAGCAAPRHGRAPA